MTTESSPLLQGEAYDEDVEAGEANVKTRSIIWSTLTLVFIVILVPLVFFPQKISDSLYPWIGLLPRDPALAALAILDKAPIIVRD